MSYIQKLSNAFFVGTVDYYDDLPPAEEHLDEVYRVRLDQGSIFLFNKKYAGYYYSDGVEWTTAPDLSFLYDSNMNSMTFGEDDTEGSWKQERDPDTWDLVKYKFKNGEWVEYARDIF